MTKPVDVPARPPDSRTTDQRAVTNDSVRRDGGKATEDLPVTTEQIKKIAHTALDHTADEAGS